MQLVYCMVISQPTLKYLQFQNPSFEANVTYDNFFLPRNPPEWSSCILNAEPDILNGVYGETHPPSDGKTYVGLFYNDSFNEETNQKLTLKKNINYNFTVDLANAKPDLYSVPIRMKVWSYNSDCAKKIYCGNHLL